MNYVQLLILLGLLFPAGTMAQPADSQVSPVQLNLRSEALGQERQLILHLPENHAYRSPDAKLPVVIILDGQHEWFAEPALTTLRYLDYIHQIPEALLVVIPSEDRISDCRQNPLGQEPTPFHRFLTEELPQALEPYGGGPLTVLISHSYCATFALYSAVHAPEHYSALLVHSPYTPMRRYIEALEAEPRFDPSRLGLSIGGKAAYLDGYHRSYYERVKADHPGFFARALLYESDLATHNSLPMLATPDLLHRLFAPFSSRYSSLAAVDSTYQLLAEPGPVQEALEQVARESVLFGQALPPEIPEIFGLASRYQNSGYALHAAAIYELGHRYHPTLYEFPLQLVEPYLESDPDKARSYLVKARELLLAESPELEDREALLEEIEGFMEEMGW